MQLFFLGKKLSQVCVVLLCLFFFLSVLLSIMYVYVGVLYMGQCVYSALALEKRKETFAHVVSAHEMQHRLDSNSLCVYMYMYTVHVHFLMAYCLVYMYTNVRCTCTYNVHEHVHTIQCIRTMYMYITAYCFFLLS